MFFLFSELAGKRERGKEYLCTLLISTLILSFLLIIYLLNFITFLKEHSPVS